MKFGVSHQGYGLMQGRCAIEYFAKEGTDPEKEFIPRAPMSDAVIAALQTLYKKTGSVDRSVEFIHSIEGQNELSRIAEEWGGDTVVWFDEVECLLVGVSDTGAKTLLMRISIYQGQPLQSSLDIAAVIWTLESEARWRPYAKKYLIAALLAAAGLYYVLPGPALLLGGLACILHAVSVSIVALYVRYVLAYEL